jgi:ribonuclease BN (tRNA processing enzyme)
MKMNITRNISTATVILASLFVLSVPLIADAGEKAYDGFTIWIVGSGNPKLSAKRAGPSVLVQYRDKQFLVDCGPGSMAGLLKAGIEPGKIKNMLFTHHHADHNADYWSFAIGGWGYPGGRRELNLVGPAGTRKLHEITLDFYSKDLDYRTKTVGFPEEGMRTKVNIKELKGDMESFEMDGVKISVLSVPHTIETYAYRFDAGGKSVVISGDLKNSSAFAVFARNADIIVFDGQMSVDFSDLPIESAEMIKGNLLKSHISNPEIARIAADAAPKKFVLNHLSGTMDLSSNIKLYREAGYKGEVIQAEDGLIIRP